MSKPLFHYGTFGQDRQLREEGCWTIEASTCFTKHTGWFWRLAIDSDEQWMGPYDTEADAQQSFADCMGMCIHCGETLDESEATQGDILCLSCLRFYS